MFSALIVKPVIPGRGDRLFCGVSIPVNHFWDGMLYGITCKIFLVNYWFSLIDGGERGIRTLGTTVSSTRDFQSRSFGQLGHLSVIYFSNEKPIHPSFKGLGKKTKPPWKKWRRGRDSNPRAPLFTGQIDFESTPLRPLRYLSRLFSEISASDSDFNTQNTTLYSCG